MAPQRPGVSNESRYTKKVLQNLPGDQKQKGGKKDAKRARVLDARSIVTQTSDAALKNGELDVRAFLRSREFEIKALQKSMQNARGNLSKRALQKVPRGMRRRTASHNVKRLPKRLQKRAAKEMKDGNTPTVTSKMRKPRSARGRIRAETAKRLGILASKKQASMGDDGKKMGVEARCFRSKILTNQLNQPPKPKSKFRKRQIHKTWLPTHVWHAKRAKMTGPQNPLWRFAIPITPTEKSYRPTHRAGGARGAIVWDMSYMSSICLEGPQKSLEYLLKAVGVKEDWLWEDKISKWRDGKRSWTGWLSKNTEENPTLMGSSTIIWCPIESKIKTGIPPPVPEKEPVRRVLIRVHPAAFLEIWTELLRLSKPQRHLIRIQDLRFEIGSIDITGPGSTEALLGILFPYHEPEAPTEPHAQIFKSLVGLTNPATLPYGTILSFTIMDPRLRYPPRTVIFPTGSEQANHNLLQMLSDWPADSFCGSRAIFDHDSRFKAAHLPSQKALNRRKSLAVPGSYPSITKTDPPIPIILFTSRSKQSASSQGTWTLLAPWKCIKPIWYGLVHYPLASGGNPRFGGLRELRQIEFEFKRPWFPSDYPGTKSGFAWEIEERHRRKAEWERRPKGKRVEWGSIDLGNGRKGEIGNGWSCDFEYLLQSGPLANLDLINENKVEEKDSPLTQMGSKDFNMILSNSSLALPLSNTIATVHITFVSRGVARSCARIYRLPGKQGTRDSCSSISQLTARERWLSLLPPDTNCKKAPRHNSKFAQKIGRIPLDTPLPQRVRLLAQSLLQQPPLDYGDQNEQNNINPLVPDEQDLIGFVTTGEYCLANGKGAAFGSLLVCKVLKDIRSGGAKAKKEAKICIVRNSGETVGRLARWEAA